MDRHTLPDAWSEHALAPGAVAAAHEVIRAVGVACLRRQHGADADARNNGRVKKALIETDGGLKKTVTLKDTRASQPNVMPKAKVAWVKLTILEVYPGCARQRHLHERASHEPGRARQRVAGDWSMIPKSVFSEKIMLKQSARAIVSVGTLCFAHLRCAPSPTSSIRRRARPCPSAPSRSRYSCRRRPACRRAA
jgi:hypothetical protein